jgi:hypothetical protein
LLDRRARPDLHPSRWSGPIVAVVGLAFLAAAYRDPVAARSLLEQGGIAVILSYERALPLIGLGSVLALMRLRLAALGALAAILGVGVAVAAHDWLIAAIVSAPAMANRLSLPGPISCVVVGLLLAAPERLRSWLLPPAAMAIGAALALGVEIVDPSFRDPNFLRGALAASVWLVAAVGLTARLCDRPWFRIAIRIVGSWLIAIGLILGAAILLPRPRVADAPLPPPETLEAPTFPGQDQRRPPGDGRFAPPRFDPLRQP